MMDFQYSPLVSLSIFVYGDILLKISLKFNVSVVNFVTIFHYGFSFYTLSKESFLSP